MNQTQDQTVDQKLKGYVYAMTHAYGQELDPMAVALTLDLCTSPAEREDLWAMVLYLRSQNWSHTQIFTRVVHDLSGFYCRYIQELGAEGYVTKNL